MGVGVVVAHLTLTQVVQVRFLYPLPNTNTLCDATVVSAAAREDKKPKHADGLAWRSVFLFGLIFEREDDMKRSSKTRKPVGV